MALTLKVKLVTSGCYWSDGQPASPTGLFFSTADILICHSWRSSGVTNNISNGFLLHEPACTMSGNSTATIRYIIYTCAFPTAMCLLWKKETLSLGWF